MYRVALLFYRLMFVIVLGVALAGSALAHLGATAAPDADLRAYVTAGGLFSDICGDMHGPHRTCDACRLTDAIILAQPHTPITIRKTIPLLTARPMAMPDPQLWQRNPMCPVRGPPMGRQKFIATL